MGENGWEREWIELNLVEFLVFLDSVVFRVGDLERRFYGKIALL